MLSFMGQHPFLTVVLVLIFFDGLAAVANAMRGDS